MKKTVAKVLPNPYIRIALIGAGLSLVLLTLQLTKVGTYSGLGTNLIDVAFIRGSAQSYDWIFEAPFYRGDHLSWIPRRRSDPALAIGATLGVFLAPMLGLPVLVVAAIGYASVFGSATTLLAPI